MIKAVLFDIDGVLLDSKEANALFFQDLLEKAGYRRPSKSEVLKIFHMTMWDTIKFLSKEKSEERIKKAWLIGCKMKYPMNLLKMPNHSKKAIKILSKDYKLGIVTSRIRRGVDRFFQFSKLRKYFDVTVSFEDYKKPKPDPESLLVALKKLKMSPNEAVYIGDAESDVKAANMKVIIYPKRLKGADFILRNFKNLPSVIERLQEIPEVVRHFDKILPHFADGRINYSKSSKAAVVTVFIKYRDKILLLKRSENVGSYKGKWGAVSGFIDKLRYIENEAMEELKEEVGILEKDIAKMRVKKSFEVHDGAIGKTWIVFPVLAELKTKSEIKLDWEHTDFRWIRPDEMKNYDTDFKLEETLRRALK
jgi:beta-phosphoglucomutase-like phosphatase (HAD superfamily)/8-oxo-dGTP pyrophosphatase MutT (NUDIX family)